MHYGGNGFEQGFFNFFTFSVAKSCYVYKTRAKSYYIFLKGACATFLKKVATSESVAKKSVFCHKPSFRFLSQFGTSVLLLPSPKLVDVLECIPK